MTLALAALICVAAPLKAQTFQEGFFLKDYRLGYRINPALAGGGNFISIGEFGKNNRFNVGAGAFLYPRDGEVLTALHPSIPAETFLGKLKDQNYTYNAYNYNIFAYGFSRGEAFHTLELNVRAQYSANVPKDLFRILKLGTTDTVYDLSRADVQGQLYAELAYGYTRKLSDIVTVGGRAKLLVGLNAVDYRMSNLKLHLDGSEYRVDVGAELDMTGRTRRFIPTEDGYLSLMSSTAAKWYVPTGAGLAVDLGVVVTPNEYLTLSASVLDLGAICWVFANSGQSIGTASFAGLNLAYEDLNKNALMDKLKDVGKDFLGTLKLKSMGSHAKVNMVPLRANLGFRYRIPTFEMVSFGVVASYIGYQNMPYWEARYCMSCTPTDWLDLACSFGTGAHGGVWGIGGSVRVQRFRLNVGVEKAFGGTVGESTTPVEPQSKVVTIGLTYDL